MTLLILWLLPLTIGIILSKIFGWVPYTEPHETRMQGLAFITTLIGLLWFVGFGAVLLGVAAAR